MKPKMHTTITVDYPPKPHQLFKIGWNAYLDGRPLDANATADERRGWNAANKAEAETLTPGYANSMNW